MTHSSEANNLFDTTQKDVQPSLENTETQEVTELILEVEKKKSE